MVGIRRNKMDIEINPLKPGVKFSSLQTFDHGDNTIFIFGDVVFGSENATTSPRYFGGTYMPISPASHYFHFLKEYVGSFLYYKKHIDETVKPLWIETPVLTLDYHDTNKPIQTIFDLLVNKIKNPIVFLNYNLMNNLHLHFEKIAVIYDSAVVFVSSEFPHFDQFKHTNNKEVRDFLQDFLIKDSSYPQKVYVSRKKVSAVLNANNSKTHISRPNEIYVDEAIEDYFIQSGFSVIDFSGMELENQIKYMYNATHVAGLIGANTWNGIFCDNNTTFYCIKTQRWFNHPYDVDIKSVINANFNYVDLFNLESYENVYNELVQKIGLAIE